MSQIVALSMLKTNAQLIIAQRVSTPLGHWFGVMKVARLFVAAKQRRCKILRMF
jgi:hypothetical protein